MKQTLFAILAAAFLPTNALAVDGVALINQSAVMAAGGFPYVISEPGSYKLSGNLVVPANTDGIDITVGNVTIDLNGFTILGPVACTGQGSTLRCLAGSRTTFGIFAQANNIAVLNGAVAGFNFGVSLGTPGIGSVVEEIRATGNAGIGINMNSGLMRRNVASLNADDGISCITSCVVLDNTADYNGNFGLNMGGGVFGSNAIDFNGLPRPGQAPDAVSQGNNSCNGIGC